MSETDCNPKIEDENDDVREIRMLADACEREARRAGLDVERDEAEVTK